MGKLHVFNILLVLQSNCYKDHPLQSNCYKDHPLEEDTLFQRHLQLMYFNQDKVIKTICQHSPVQCCYLGSDLSLKVVILVVICL